MRYFTIFQDKLHSVNIQDDQLWAFSETVQKISKITYTASQFSLLTSAKFAVNINRVTLQQNKEFIMFIFLFDGFITMCNLKKRLIREVFWILTKCSSERFLSIWGEKINPNAFKFCKLISNLILGQIIVSNLTNVHKLAA